MSASPYTAAIRRELDRLGPRGDGVDPRHVEAYMRVGHGTLDHLNPQRMTAEVSLAVLCIELSGTEEAEALARSYGL